MKKSSDKGQTISHCDYVEHSMGYWFHLIMFDHFKLAAIHQNESLKIG